MKTQTRSSNGHRSRAPKSNPSGSMTAKSESPEHKASQARLMPASTPISRKGNSIVVFDTNIFLSHPKCISTYLKKGYDVFIPSFVLEELDVCKDDYKNRQKSTRALAVQKIILQYMEDKNPRIHFSPNRNFANLAIEKKDRPDSIILASINWLIGSVSRTCGVYSKYQRVLFLTNDNGFKLIAKVLLGPKGLHVDSYKEQPVKKTSLNIPSYKVAGNKIYNREAQQYCEISGDKIKENEAVIIHTDYRTDAWHDHRVAVRNDKELIFINPNITASNFTAKSNGRPNWEQMLALHYILDPMVTCTILQGPAGTGKTLIALAAALELLQLPQYSRISIYRPMVSVDSEGVGFLPGDEKHKVAPWMKPIFRNLEKILKKMEQVKVLSGDKSHRKTKSNGRKKEEPSPPFHGTLSGAEGLQIMSAMGIDAEILSFTCGETIDNRVMIVDDAQNLSKNEMKNILTRVGENTKIIITGDLQQIHVRGLAKEESGLYYAVTLLKGDPRIGIVNFTDQTIVRSEFVRCVVNNFEMIDKKHGAA